MEICPNCNSNLSLEYKLKYNIFKCRSCNLLIADGAVFGITEDLLLNEGARERALKSLRIKNFAKSIKFIQSCFPNKKLNGLEVGCGYGWFLDLCKRHHINCLGIEPETRFNQVYKINGHSVINGFYPDDLDSKMKFDFIIFNDALEHIPDIGKVMNSNSNHLLPSGLLVVNIPVQNGLFYLGSVAFYHLRFKTFLNRMWQFNFTSPHLYYFTRKNLIDLAHKNGLELIQTESSLVLDPYQIKNRILQDTQINSLRLILYTLVAFFALPFTKIMPDVVCFYFRKNGKVMN